MPKMKTDSGAKKRIKVTGSGKLRRAQGLPWSPDGEEVVGALSAPGARDRYRARAKRSTSSACWACREFERERGSCHGTSKEGGQRQEAPQGDSGRGEGLLRRPQPDLSQPLTRPSSTRASTPFATDARARVRCASSGSSASTPALAQHGMSYSRFIAGLNAAGIEVDRRMLADLAVNDAAAFGAIVAQASAALTK